MLGNACIKSQRLNLAIRAAIFASSPLFTPMNEANHMELTFPPRLVTLGFENLAPGL